MKRPGGLVALLLALGAAGCGAPDLATSPEAEELAAKVDFSGEDFFRGIVLGAGPVKPLLPELARMQATVAPASCDELRTRVHAATLPADLAARMDRAIGRACGGARMTDTARARAYDAVVAQVRTTEPRFLEAFKAEVTSGDPVRVQRALEHAAKSFLAAVDLIPGALPTGLRSDNGSYIYWGLLDFHAVALYLGPAFIVVLGSDQQVALERAQIVDLVARRFAR